MFKYIATALLVAAVGAWPLAALAVSCADAAMVAAWLEGEHAERRAAFGLGADGRLIEFYLGPGGGFTIVGTSPQGVSCILLHGTGWGPSPAGEPPGNPA